MWLDTCGCQHESEPKAKARAVRKVGLFKLFSGIQLCVVMKRFYATHQNRISRAQWWHRVIHIGLNSPHVGSKHWDQCKWRAVSHSEHRFPGCRKAVLEFGAVFGELCKGTNSLTPIFPGSYNNSSTPEPPSNIYIYISLSIQNQNM